MAPADEHPAAYTLTQAATTRASLLGHRLSLEWLVTEDLLINRCKKCKRGVFVTPETAEVGGPALEEGPCPIQDEEGED